MSSQTLPNGYTKEQLDEMRAFNATLTTAGNKARPGRARVGGASRAHGAPVAQSRLSLVSSQISPWYAPRTGSGVGSTGTLNQYTVGPSTAAPTFKPASPPRGRISSVPNSYGSGLNIDRNGYGTMGTHSITPASTPAIRPRSPVRTTRETLLVPQKSSPAPPQLTAPPRRGELIVTNMTPDDPSKPFIPAHFKQPSAFGAIKEISEMTGTPIDVLTTDGVSIPAPRARTASSSNVTSPVPSVTQVTSPTTFQRSVDPNGWFSAVTNKSSQGSHQRRDKRSYSDMDIDVDDSWGSLKPADAAGFTTGNVSNNEVTKSLATLADSRWATPAAAVSSFGAGAASQAPNSFALNGAADTSRPSNQFAPNSAFAASYVPPAVSHFGYNGGAEEFKPLNYFAPTSTWSNASAAPASSQSRFATASNNGWPSYTSEGTSQSGLPATSNNGWPSYNTSSFNSTPAAPALQPVTNFYTTITQPQAPNSFAAQPVSQAQASTNATAAIVERAGKKVSFLKDSRWA